jgi:DNA-binding transcriptional regulator YiaG
MDSTEYRAELAALGLSQRGFAKYCGADERTSHRWASGQQTIPLWVPVMLRLMRLETTAGGSRVEALRAE